MTDRYPLAKFAVFAIVCLGFGAWLVGTIGNISLADRTTYRAEFADVTGLVDNDAVKISGVTVGKVTGIEVVPGGTAEVTFEVNDEIDVTRDSLVSIRWRDVLGLRFLYLEPGDGEPVEPGHRFPVAQTDSPADLGLLLNRLVPITNALRPELQNRVLEALSEALVGREQQVRELISRGASLTQTIASRDQEISRLLRNSAEILKQYDAREEALKGFIDSFAEVSETLEARNDTLNRTITQVRRAQEELGSLVERNGGELRAAIDNAKDITDVLADNHDNLREILRTGGNTVAYHYVSRLGQWFNINAVGVSFNGTVLSTTRGATLPGPEDRQRRESASGGSAQQSGRSGSSGSGDSGSGSSGGSSGNGSSGNGGGGDSGSGSNPLDEFLGAATGGGG